MVRTVILLGVPALAVLLWSGCRKVEPEAQDEVLHVGKTTTGVEMGFIPGGAFEMGSPENLEMDEPLHEVYVSPFYMDKHEVTNAMYLQFVQVTGNRRSLFT